MLLRRENQVDAGRFDVGMAQHIRQAHHVPADSVKGSGEQMAQIVGEHFGRLHIRLPTQRLHFSPDLLSGKTASISGDENLTGRDSIFPRILQQLAAELFLQKDGPDLSLHGDFCHSVFGRFHGDIADLADPDTGSAHRLYQHGKTFPPQSPGRIQ